MSYYDSTLPLNSSSSSSSPATSPSSSEFNRSDDESRKRKRPTPCDSSMTSKKAKIEVGGKSHVDIDRFLQCSICLDFASSPIHSCDNAHVLCGQCVTKVKECPTCKLKKLSPSPLGEKLAKEANKKIQCFYSEIGCNEMVLSTKFLEHLKVCYSRDAICPRTGCENVELPLSDYAKHMKDHHQRGISTGSKYCRLYTYNKEKKRDNVIWKQSFMDFDGTEFVLQAQLNLKMNTFYTWVSVLGDKTMAEKYNCKIRVSDPEIGSKFACNWTVPVLPFHEIVDDDLSPEIFDACTIMGIPATIVKKWEQFMVDKDGDERAGFYVNYEIVQV